LRGFGRRVTSRDEKKGPFGVNVFFQLGRIIQLKNKSKVDGRKLKGFELSKSWGGLGGRRGDPGRNGVSPKLGNEKVLGRGEGPVSLNVGKDIEKNALES